MPLGTSDVIGSASVEVRADLSKLLDGFRQAEAV